MQSYMSCAKLISQLASGCYINLLIFSTNQEICLDLLQLIKWFLLIISHYLESEMITITNYLECEINHINLVLRFEWSKWP